MLWLLLAAQAATPLATPPKPANDPGTWIGIADYPAAALSQHQQGTVGFTLTIDAQGKIIDCIITGSSGATALDDATCALLRARAQFATARDASGTAIAGRFSSRIRWVYPAIKAAASPAAVELPRVAADKTGASDIWVGADGIITRCQDAPMPYANILPPPSLCAAYPVGSRFSPPTTLRGKPQSRRIRITVNTSETYVR